MEQGRLRFWHRTSCVIAFAFFGIRFNGAGLGFSGEILTGDCLDWPKIGSLLFLAAICLTFFLPRIAAMTALVAAIGYAPFYLNPGILVLFQRIFRGGYSMPELGLFDWAFWTIVGLAIVVVAALLSIIILFGQRKRTSLRSGTQHAWLD